MDKIFNFVNSLKCSPVYKLIDNGGCDSKTNAIVPPIFYIQDYYNYENISCSPSPISNTVENGAYYLYLDYGVNYTITLTNTSCDVPNIVIQETTKNYPRVVITQPKCLYSSATINFIANDTNSKRNYYIQNTQVQLPYEMVYNSNQAISFYSAINNQTECKSNLYLKSEIEGTLNLPEIEVIPATCNISGEINILNYQNYTQITLYNSNNITISSNNTNGTFVNLAASQYTLVLVSDTCGKQSLAITVENTPPPYLMALEDESCPSKPMFSISFNGTYNYSINKGSQTLHNPFEYDHQPIFVNITNCIAFQIPPVSYASVPPIKYTVSKLEDYCNKNYTITLDYDSSLVSDLIIEYFNIDNIRDSGVVSLNGKSFTADIDHRYEISSSYCYSDKIKIESPSPVPSYTFSNKTSYCNELIDISITNWENFTTLYIIASNNDGSAQPIPSVNGTFKQVPNQQYNLFYVYENCTDNERFIKIGNNNIDANIYYTTNIINQPTCNDAFNGILEIIVFDKFTDKEIVRVNETLTYYDDFTIKYLINLLPVFGCSANVTFNYDRKIPDYQITTLTKPVCIYSKQNATISINSSTSIGSVLINGIKQNISVPYQVPIGNNTITINFVSNGAICYSITTFYNVETQFPDFQVKYDTTPINDCSANTGCLSIIDYSNYTSLAISNVSILATGNSSNTYPSGDVQVDFSILLDKEAICSGSVDIYIPTSIQINEASPSFQVIQQPLCDADNSGVIVFDTIKSTDNKIYVIDSIEGDNTNALSPGNHTFMVYSGSCSWEIPVQINSTNVVIEPVLESYFINQCAGSYRYKLTYNNYLAEKTSVAKTNNNQIGNIIIGDTLSNSKVINVNIKYGNKQVCQQILNIEPQKPTYIPNINYTIITNSINRTCLTDNDIDIKVENYNQYQNLLYGSVAIDSEGFFKNVRRGDFITASHYKFNCNITTHVLYDKQPITIQYSTCIKKEDYLLLKILMPVSVFIIGLVLVILIIIKKRKDNKEYQSRHFIKLTSTEEDESQFDLYNSTR
ncbi:hypothetical protein DICPUDRAFT_83219 [Dictyostelium purpureum]|uniref:Uncharacterized protein n=1 Tax=Dictyostelium purpureum TaxID=5786 RepID=F0ZYW7_DICPU|nr:uncharacterized protein DICPUDRAFT_83219 [Dictyostelium purpureum]EGC30875.1 hypothetical protein DICPUDRAFT_83219 [Dictyostelium purpureum]|eukprot:XP_003292612.1 hypothetical protein DICPUDRAFT_83219 [Dictyostelium purpureum]